MRLPGSANVLESRRRRALALLEQGRSFNAAARAPGSGDRSTRALSARIDAARLGETVALVIVTNPCSSAMVRVAFKKLL